MLEKMEVRRTRVLESFSPEQVEAILRCASTVFVVKALVQSCPLFYYTFKRNQRKIVLGVLLNLKEMRARLDGQTLLMSEYRDHAI